MLLQKVFSHVDLLEVKYFGLQFNDNYNVNVSLQHQSVIIIIIIIVTTVCRVMCYCEMLSQSVYRL